LTHTWVRDTVMWYWSVDSLFWKCEISHWLPCGAEGRSDGRTVGCRANKGWAVKRARPSKKVWCSGLGLCLEMSLVFDFVQGLRCGLSIRHCRCYWIMAAWFVFLHFFLVPLCWYAVSERQMLLFFAGGLVGVDKHLFQRVSLITSMTLPLNYIFVLLLANFKKKKKKKNN